MKSILIEKEVHDKLLKIKNKTHVSIKSLVETAIRQYVRRIELDDDEEDK